MSYNEQYLLGYLAGVINGISLREDVPGDVQDSCIKAYQKFLEFYNQEEEKDKK